MVFLASRMMAMVGILEGASKGLSWPWKNCRCLPAARSVKINLHHQGTQKLVYQMPQMPKLCERVARGGNSNFVIRSCYGAGPSKAYNFSSAASPAAEKDKNPDTLVESAAGEKVETATTDSSQEVETEGSSDQKPEITGKREVVPPVEVDKDTLMKIIVERELLLADKIKQIAELKERLLSSMAELENVKERLRRESEMTKKYAIQEFAKELLDVADNLERAIATVPEDVRTETLANRSSETAKFSTSETAKYLKTLLEGVIITEKELLHVFKKFGIEKFEPDISQQFDPNLHLALYEVADPCKKPGTVAVVVKPGYMLHDRVLRPAEVGVAKNVE